MKAITIASIAYIATLVRVSQRLFTFYSCSHLEQVCFVLSSSAVFSWSDKSTDSKCFYKSIMDFLESPSEEEEVKELLKSWNRVVFPFLTTLLPY